MHYSQGRDRWFGRIQSAPTVNVNNVFLSLMVMVGETGNHLY
ncbi:hypothetical protein [Phocaeicola sp.]